MTTLCKVSLDFFSLGRRMVDVIHICVAMKPLEGNFAQNALEQGVAGLNVDGCRIPYGEGNEPIPQLAQGKTKVNSTKTMFDGQSLHKSKTEAVIGGSLDGRFPANVILDEEAGALLDEQSGNRKTGVVTPQNISRTQKSTYGKPNQNCNQASYGGEGGASRFFKVIGDEE